MSFYPWLFNQSGSQAVHHRHYRDPAVTSLDKDDLQSSLITMTIDQDIPWSPVTWAVLPNSAYMAVDGEAFCAVDYVGDTLTIVDATNDTGTWSINFPWMGLPLLAYYDDDDIFCRYITCMDIRYSFLAYGEWDWPGNGNYIYTHKDYLTVNDAVPVQLGVTYTGDWDDTTDWFSNSGPLPGISGHNSNMVAYLSQGSSVVFLRPDTYIFSHELDKWAVPQGVSDLAYQTMREVEQAPVYYKSNDWRSRRIFYSSVTVNGVDLGTLPEVSGSYAPYTLDSEMQYCTVSLG